MFTQDLLGGDAELKDKDALNRHVAAIAQDVALHGLAAMEKATFIRPREGEVAQERAQKVALSGLTTVEEITLPRLAATEKAMHNAGDCAPQSPGM